MVDETTRISDPIRTRKDGPVHEKLELLLSELKREDVPAHLLELALQLQHALDAQQK